MTDSQELPIIQKMYDLILWFVPRLNKFPRDFKFMLGDRIQSQMMRVLEGLIRARFRREKLEMLAGLNTDLEVLRHQIRLCRDFKLLDDRRFEHVCRAVNEIGENLGGWMRQQRSRA